MPNTKGQKFPAEPLTPAEAKSLLAACGPSSIGLRNRALLVLLWRAGLRIAEALSVHPRDLDDGVLRVRRGKGSKARTVALDPEALAVVQAWLERKARLGIAGPIISTLRGESVLASYVRNLLPRLAAKAGIAKRVHAHGIPSLPGWRMSRSTSESSSERSATPASPRRSDTSITCGRPP